MAEAYCELCGKTFKDSRGLAGHMQWKHSDKSASNNTASVTTRSAGYSSPEQIVDVMPRPTTVNGEVNEAFIAGMRYEAMNVIRGIRMAQEISKITLEQAKPVIEVAKVMRQAEGQAAEEMANNLSQLTMQGNQQVLSAINNLASSQSSSGQSTSGGSPMEEAMVDAMKPYLQQTMQQVLSGMMGSMPQQAAGQQQPQPEPWQPPNITEKSIDEYEETL